MSEASYLKSLHLVIKHFAQSVEFDALHSPAAILTKRDYKILFSNIESVWTVSARFLGLLERVWNHNPILSPGQICGLIAEYAARHFDVYINYCTNQMFQNRKLGELKKNNDFMEVLTRLENHPQCKGLSMRSFLLLPVQRITRLPLLVDGVCHRMDTASPDYPVAMKCLHVLQKLAKQCNEGAKRMHNLEEMTRINQLLDFRNVRTIALVSESRSLVKQGQLTRILTSSQGILDKWTRRKELLHLFLFNDILLITKKRGERYEVIDSAPRISIHADIIQEDQVTNWLPNGSPRHCKNLFVMALLEKTTEYIFSADSMSERTRWVEATTPSQQVNEDETIYESWDCPQVQVIERYEPNQPDELQLEESDVVDVFRKMADGWFEGERIRDGERGWFPSSCTVEIVGEHRRAKNMRQRYRLLHSMQAFN
ncbi:hypothetical protein NP493_1426g00004 [Ridgeia piscesae]|uniref:Uncharacterized protein n=1 Tax=Ridgeia piscesae TaxID=27915 RepID=A0AAD9ND58_RIDPI|nr:hypothetical protein NP493_1426g00004 [Ridgeia piscesae]